MFGRWHKGRRLSWISEEQHDLEASEIENRLSQLNPSFRQGSVGTYYFSGMKKRVTWIKKDTDKMVDTDAY